MVLVSAIKAGNPLPTEMKGSHMPTMKKGYKALVDEANAEIEAVTPA
jgi:hypothetical protein